MTVKLWTRLCGAGFAVVSVAADDSWLGWDTRRAEAIGRAAYVQRRIGRLFDTRLLKTERAQNYRLAAIWIHPDVVRASARLVQEAERLSDDATRSLVTEVEIAGHTIVMVELDPREGSGVIPTEWSAFLAPTNDGKVGSVVRGALRPELRSMRAAAGVLRRNDDYDRFWLVFPLTYQDGTPLLVRTLKRPH